MNILPKKSWHVRSRKNIERVRQDEAKAAEEEIEKQRRIAIADTEAKTEILRQRARKRRREEGGEIIEKPEPEHMGHINLFRDEEEWNRTIGTNAEYEAEKRAEKEKHEKAIGLLTYLGQSAVESQTEKPWYHKPPTKKIKLEGPELSVHLQKYKKLREEFDYNHKWGYDPMTQMTKYLHQKEKIAERDKGKTSTKAAASDDRRHPSRVDRHPTAQRPGDQSRDTVSDDRRHPPRVDRHPTAQGPGDQSSHTVSVKQTPKEKMTVRRHKKKKEMKHKRKHKHKKKHKKEKQEISLPADKEPNCVVPLATSGGKSIEQLRAERLKRERQERHRANKLLGRARGDSPTRRQTPEPSERQRGYNTLYNPKFVQNRRRERYHDRR